MAVLPMSQSDDEPPFEPLVLPDDYQPAPDIQRLIGEGLAEN